MTLTQYVRLVEGNACNNKQYELYIYPRNNRIGGFFLS